MFQYSATKSAQERRLHYHLITSPHSTATTELLEIHILGARYIHDDDTPLITLTMIAMDTIDNLKANFFPKTRTEQHDWDEDHKLLFGSQQLEDDCTISDYNIQHGCTLVALTSECGAWEHHDGSAWLWFYMESEPQMCAFTTGLLDLSASSVKSMKTHISSMVIQEDIWAEWGEYDLNKLHFTCNGVELEDENLALCDYNIENGHVIVCRA